MSARLVVDIGDAIDLAFLHQFGDILNELLLIDTVGNLRDHNLVVAVVALYLGLGTHENATLSRLVGIFYTLQAVDVGTCGEVGGGDVLHQSVGADLRVIDVGAASVDHFSKIVCRDIGCHTDGNTVATVDEQVGNLCRHDGWFLQRVVKVVHHVDCVLVDVVHDVLTHLGETALGVTHGCR